MNDLKNNRSIVTQPCDKGGGVCIMNIRDYLTKIYTHLQDHNTYKLLTHNPKNAIAHDACTLMHYMHSQHIIDTTTMELLLSPRNTCTPLFHGLPKIHKSNCTLRHIVSGCGGPTDPLSSNITHKPLPNNLPSHIKDTIHFLNLIEKLPSLPTNAILVTADLTSLKQTFHMMVLYQPSFISWRNTSISYPQTAHYSI